MKSGALRLYNILLLTVKGSTGLPVHCGCSSTLAMHYFGTPTVALRRDHCWSTVTMKDG